MYTEPTNMLDVNAVLWLENYLQEWPHTIMCVSHDRDFLNAICTDIIHMYRQTLDPYKGDYDTFERSRAEKLQNLKKVTISGDCFVEEYIFFFLYFYLFLFFINFFIFINFFFHIHSLKTGI